MVDKQWEIDQTTRFELSTDCDNAYGMKTPNRVEKERSIRELSHKPTPCDQAVTSPIALVPLMPKTSNFELAITRTKFSLYTGSFGASGTNVQLIWRLRR